MKLNVKMCEDAEELYYAFTLTTRTCLFHSVEISVMLTENSYGALFTMVLGYLRGTTTEFRNLPIFTKKSAVSRSPQNAVFFFLLDQENILPPAALDKGVNVLS